MLLAFKRLILLTSVAVVFAADKDKPMIDIKPAASYTHHQTSQGVTIAAIPYDTEELAKSAFGKLNPNEKGILPILVVIDNPTGNVIRLNGLKVEYVAPGGIRVLNTPAQDLRFLRGAKEPKITPGPVGGVHVSRNKNPLGEWEIEGRAFSAKIVPPNDRASGFFYFQTGRRGSASLYLTGLVDAKSGQELFYFEIPLN